MSPIATARTHSIATIGADGIGPEVVGAGVQVLKKLAQLDGTFGLEFQDFDWSSDTYKKTGQYIPEGGLEQLKKHDAILFGAVGAPGRSNQSVPKILLMIMQMFLITFPFGVYVSPFANHSSNTRTFDQLRSSVALNHPYERHSTVTWIG